MGTSVIALQNALDGILDPADGGLDLSLGPLGSAFRDQLVVARGFTVFAPTAAKASAKAREREKLAAGGEEVVVLNRDDALGAVDRGRVPTLRIDRAVHAA